MQPALSWLRRADAVRPGSRPRASATGHAGRLPLGPSWRLRALLGRTLAAICITTLFACTAGDPAVRPNHLVLNESLALEPGAQASWPLYLTRRGEYYVEVTLASPDAQASGPIDPLRLALEVVDGEAVLLERERSVALAASRPAATLAWFSSDREVPLKDRVTLRLAVADMPPAAAASSRLLVQVRRKVNRPLPR